MRASEARCWLLLVGRARDIYQSRLSTFGVRTATASEQLARLRGARLCTNRIAAFPFVTWQIDVPSVDSGCGARASGRRRRINHERWWTCHEARWTSHLRWWTCHEARRTGNERWWRRFRVRWRRRLRGWRLAEAILRERGDSELYHEATVQKHSSHRASNDEHPSVCGVAAMPPVKP